jgi:hypothetical protein
MRTPILDREEYIEQAYFFRVYRERLQENVPSQEILLIIQDEILATTRLPMAIDFMRTEILHSGRISDAMLRLPHYFSPFQTFVIQRAEADESRFEQIVALKILESEAGYRARNPTQSGMFVYQFECIARNRLGYADGLKAMAQDPLYSEDWQRWIGNLGNELGGRELSEVIYLASQHFHNRRSTRSTQKGDGVATTPTTLFGDQEGRIAMANIGRDPLFFFAALQRQLDYPAVPRSQRVDDIQKLPAFLEARLVKLEQRLKIAEMEAKGGINLKQFYKHPDHTDVSQPR